MNRFYKPTPREYVSTHVDMPWEFLQGVAEQKQKGYDSALGLGDAGSKLLDFNSTPGDYEQKQIVQNKYNDKFAEITDYIQKTGDYTGASRKFTSVIRDITKDRGIQIMKAAYEPWQKDREADLNLEGKATPFSRPFNYMHSTFDKKLNDFKPYSQRRGYEGIAVGKQFKEEFEQSIANVHANTRGERIHKNKDGDWVDRSNTKVTKERLKPLLDASLKELIPRYSQYVSDFINWEKKQGKSGYGWLDNMTAQIIGERLVDDSTIKYIENDFNTGRRLKELDQASNIMDFTGMVTPRNLNYKKLSEQQSTGQAIIKDLDAKIAISKNSVEKAQLIAKRDAQKQLLQMNSTSLKFIDKVMTTDNNFLQIYKQYTDAMTYQNNLRKSQGLSVLLPVETKYEFQKYLTGEKPLPPMGSAAGGLSGILELAKNKYREAAQVIASSGAYSQEDEYMIDPNESSNFNSYIKAIKKSIFDKTLNATVVGGGDNANVNLSTLIEKKLSNADMSKSSVTAIKNTTANQVSFELTLRNKEGEEIDGGRVQFVSSKDGSQINSVFNKTIALEASKSRNAGDSDGYYQNAQRLADMNHGEGLTMLKAFVNENKIVLETDPVQVGRFFVYNAKDESGKGIPNVFIMTQGYIDTDGSTILSSTDVEKNPNNSSPYLSYGDITKKLGVELVNQYAKIK